MISSAYRLDYGLKDVMGTASRLQTGWRHRYRVILWTEWRHSYRV